MSKETESISLGKGDWVYVPLLGSKAKKKRDPG